MIQFENFSEKAKQVIKLVKNNKYKTISKNHFKDEMISYSCALFNVWQEQGEVLEYCKSKNYWLDSK